MKHHPLGLYCNVNEYGGRFVPKFHHTIAKLEQIVFMRIFAILGYALFIWVCTFHLGVHFHLGMQLSLGMPFQFGCALFIYARACA